ncbi:MAG: hypothetical protein WCU88_05645 [Elusimicrobiota bacterium]|jgi:hypothetical protein
MKKINSAVSRVLALSLISSALPGQAAAAFAAANLSVPAENALISLNLTGALAQPMPNASMIGRIQGLISSADPAALQQYPNLSLIPRLSEQCLVDRQFAQSLGGMFRMSGGVEKQSLSDINDDILMLRPVILTLVQQQAEQLRAAAEFWFPEPQYSASSDFEKYRVLDYKELNESLDEIKALRGKILMQQAKKTADALQEGQRSEQELPLSGESKKIVLAAPVSGGIPLRATFIRAGSKKQEIPLHGQGLEKIALPSSQSTNVSGTLKKLAAMDAKVSRRVRIAAGVSLLAAAVFFPVQLFIMPGTLKAVATTVLLTVTVYGGITAAQFGSLIPADRVAQVLKRDIARRELLSKEEFAIADRMYLNAMLRESAAAVLSMSAAVAFWMMGQGLFAGLLGIYTLNEADDVFNRFLAQKAAALKTAAFEPARIPAIKMFSAATLGILIPAGLFAAYKLVGLGMPALLHVMPFAVLGLWVASAAYSILAAFYLRHALAKRVLGKDASAK